MGNDVNKLKQRLEIRKYLVFAGMFLLFLGAMWLIFAPSEEEKRKEEKNAGFNTELPDPRGAGIEGDKIAAYEQADMKRKQTEKLRTLEDFSEMADGNSGTVVELSPDADAKDGSSREGDRRNEACSSSVSAYNDINFCDASYFHYSINGFEDCRERLVRHRFIDDSFCYGSRNLLHKIVAGEFPGHILFI